MPTLDSARSMPSDEAGAPIEAHRSRASAAELARLLRALPAVGDWSETQASQWWTQFRQLPKQAAQSAPTLTITVDLEGRAA